MVATKKSVISQLQEIYNVDEGVAQNLLEYDMIIRGRLNRMHSLAQVADSVSLQGSAASETTALAKEAVSAIPVFGGIAGLVGYGIHRGVQAAERHFKLGEAKNIRNMNPSSDQGEWCEFTKELSQNLVEALVKHTSAKDLANTDSIKSRAERDSTTIANLMLKGKALEISDPKAIPSLVRMEALLDHGHSANSSLVR